MMYRLDFQHHHTLLAVIVGLVLNCGWLMGQAPEISDPDGRAEGPMMPGDFPTSVTAANVNAAPIPGSILGGTGSDNILVQVPASGPIAWTESRHNEGDIAMLIGPLDPSDDSYYPPANFVEDYRPLQDQPFENTTLAWRVSRDNGALLATVRHNGVDNQDTLDGANAVGTIHGVAYFNADFGQGWGYRMNDGVFANGGGSSADLQMGVAGPDGDRGEAVFNTAVAFFPYEEGWLGAWVEGRNEDGPANFTHGNPTLESSSVLWFNNGLAAVTLPDINPQMGMLFVAPSDGDNATDIVATSPDLGGWIVTVREDANTDVSGTSYKADNNGFQFLYVPYSAPGLIGGYVDGEDGLLISGAGQNRFSLERSENGGEYALSIFDNDGQAKLTGDDGMLILSVAAQVPGDNSALADRTFLSYEYDGVSGDFVIQSREVGDEDGSVFGHELPLRDTNFYFAYVDFEDPLRLSVACDFDGDGICDVTDIDDLVLRISAGDADPTYDLDGDGLVTVADLEQWRSTAGGFNLGAGRVYLAGDANLDGTVNAADLNAVALGWQQAVTTWSGGNFTADGIVDSQDLNVLALNWQASAAPRTASVVPEPAGITLAIIVVTPILLINRRTPRTKAQTPAR